MAKADIHPDYHPITIETFNKDGSKLVFQSASTIKADKIVAEINIFNHPAWKEDAGVDAENSVNKVMQKFNARFKKVQG